MIAKLKAGMTIAELTALQQEVPTIHASDALIDYVQAIVVHTRDSAKYELGLSPRAGLALLRAAQAWAFMAGRNQVLPEDVQAVAPAVVGHRLRPVANGNNKALEPAQDLIQSVPIP